MLDAGARTLSHAGQRRHLTPKALDVLVLLATERPRAVPKEEILERAWPGTFVTDASLARTIHEIREALGDQAAQQTIRTVHGHGYSFVADAEDLGDDGDRPGPPPQVRAWLLEGKQAIPLADGEVLLGRDPAVAIALTSIQVSWHHVRFVVRSDGVTIEDLGSKNGTELRGQRLTAVTALQDGDAIDVGGTRFVFRTGEIHTETATRP